jgi:hypothetical protein
MIINTAIAAPSAPNKAIAIGRPKYPVLPVPPAKANKYAVPSCQINLPNKSAKKEATVQMANEEMRK